MSETLYYKYCKHTDYYEHYTNSFHMELSYMNKLQSLMEQQHAQPSYSQFFPYYYATNTSNGCPYIKMEHINGVTLEELLQQTQPSPRPRHLFANDQILHLYEQLHEAIHWLYQGGMMQMDLSPQNIIILNQDFDIKLIDFTDCYYIDFPTRNYKKIDYRLNTNANIGIQLRDTCALLFTRLFFSGKTHYDSLFSIDDTNIRLFFQKEYYQLLNCIFYPNTIQYHTDMDDLSYLEDWYEYLIRILKKY